MVEEEYKDIELIERYLEEKLNPQEIAAFQERLKTDLEFENAFQSYRTLIAGINYSGENVLRQKLKKLEASITVQESFDRTLLGIPLKSFYSYSAAATVLLLITFGLIFILRHDATPREVFAQNFQPYPNVVMPTTRGDEGEKNEKQQAFYLYDQGKFNEAALLFDKLGKDENDPSLLLYSANAYMATGNYDLGLQRLKNLLTKNSEYKTQAEWFTALAYLGKNEPQSAKTYLEALKKENNSYSKKAEKILDDLELVGN